MQPDIKSQTQGRAARPNFKDWEQPAYRVAQLLRWLYEQRATRLGGDDESAARRCAKNCASELHASARSNSSAQQGSRDTTQKFLWRLDEARSIESVLIPANPALYGEASDRHTLCVSTQVGCAYGCKFCASGLDGWKRNLRPHEIVEQVLAVERWSDAVSLKLEVERRAQSRH